MEPPNHLLLVAVKQVALERFEHYRVKGERVTARAAMASFILASVAGVVNVYAIAVVNFPVETDYGYGIYTQT